MHRPWRQSYPPDVPFEIDPAELGSLVELLRRARANFADRAAFEQAGRLLTFEDLYQYSRDFAGWLHARGLAKSERLVIMLPNCLQYPVALFGALWAGLTVVNVNPLYTAAELNYQLVDSGASAIVVLEELAHVIDQAVDRTHIREVIVTAAGDLPGDARPGISADAARHGHAKIPAGAACAITRLPDALAHGRRLDPLPPQAAAQDMAFLQYTGGTTGVSKGAMLSHGNVVANVLQADAWLAQRLPREGGVTMTAIPLYHIFGLSVNCLLFVHLGWKNVLVMNARDCAGLVAEMKRHTLVCFNGVNTLFNSLLHTDGFAEVDFGHLRVTLGGGMAVQPSVARQWRAVTGSVLTQGWGLTETSPVATINPLTEEFSGSIGLPVPSTDIAIKDELGNDLLIGETGEICVRGPQVMRGYWNRPEETAQVMLAGGWLRTGDLGYMNPRGYVFLQDRKKDLILVSGFNVYPNEVEEVAVSHQGILEAAAVAEQAARSGEAVALYVVAQDPRVTAQDIIEHCRKFLTAYKVPKHVYFRSELPKSNVGKILRRQLRADDPAP